jgi:hypothetical protein
MINKIGLELPACPPRYASKALGGDYLPSGPQKDAARRLFPTAIDVFDNEGDWSGRQAETVFALVPDVDNTHNAQAVAVVVPAEDGAVSLANQVGWLPNGRCATVQPRLMSLMRATGGFAGVPGFASYSSTHADDDWDNRQWVEDDADFRVRLCSWEQLHYIVQAILRETEPDVEQPWVVNRAPRSTLSKRMYDAEGASELLAVRFEIHDGSLVATLDGDLLTDITGGPGDFFDTLHDRVATYGPTRGWARVQKGSVEIWHEGEPPEVDPSGQVVVS